MVWVKYMVIGVWLGLTALPGQVEARPGGVRACAWPTAGMMGCFARLSSVGRHAPVGYGPNVLKAAYRMPINGATTTVAVVSAYNDALIKADLDHYDVVFGLPALPSCTGRSQTACFERLDQRGGQRYGAADAGWAAETALDVETIHQLCPRCRLELVVADTASLADLMAAVDRAVVAGARVVSMSWGGPETASELGADAHFAAVGVSFVASSGDGGYGVSYPAASARVIAVGGTRLGATSAGRTSESAWSGSGSGCSRYEPKPGWQHDAQCAGRTVADISADADPSTGAAIYSSLSPGGAGWMEVGGTSLAAPLVAGMIALAGGSSISHIYAGVGTTAFYDVTVGRNGSCGRSYLCTAGAGYDGPTGVGTPNGLRSLR